MKIDFEHLGSIEQGSITLNDFTVFCGKNNSGKTYAMYSIYGLLNNKFNISFEFVKPIVDKLKQDGTYCLDINEIIATHQEDMLKHIEKKLQDYLPSLFGATDSKNFTTKIRLYFSEQEIQNRIKYNLCHLGYAGVEQGLLWVVSCDSIRDNKIELTLNDTNINVSNSFLQSWLSEQLVEIMLYDWKNFKNDFLLPAERVGINLFYKELFSIRNLLLQESQNDSVNPMRLLKDVLSARYAEPIKDYLQFLNQISTTKNDTSNYIKYAEIIQSEIVKGRYKVDDFGNIFFTPFDSENKLPLHFSSSTVKSLFGLAFYLEHLAKPDDYLMIDEPEQNLHPDNQRQIARILAQLVNAGLKVIVSTHSDYFVRELNNLIMLEKNFSGATELQKKYGYQDNELLNSKQISAYLFDNNKITPIILDEDEGIIAETFDDVINNLNKSSNEIYYTMQDAKEVIE